MAYFNPSIADFKTFFSRDFPYGEDETTSITDTDIAKAFQITNAKLNPAIFSDQATYTIGYQYLSAHNLVISIQTSSQGISGKNNFLEQSKSVGSISQSSAIPQRILDNPLWGQYATTRYGYEYLMLVYPKLVGQMFAVRGGTRP